MNRILLTAVCSFFLVTVLLINRSDATPLFAVQSAERCDTCHVMPDKSDPEWVEENYSLAERKCGLSCRVCHVNPAGGMIRNRTGEYFGTKTLPLWTASDETERTGPGTVGPGVPLSIGGDFRFMNLITDMDGKTEPHYFPMQGDLYLNARLMKYVSFTSQFGLERGGNAAVREVFGLVDNLPYNAYLKAGKFVPPYGHRLEDHTAYIRSKIAFDHSRPETYVSGIEAGADPLVLFTNIAYFNEDATPSADTGRLGKGVSGIAGWRGLWLTLGGSYLTISDFRVTPASSTDRSSYGVFGSLRFSRIALLFEYDKVKDEISSAGIQSDRNSMVSFNELDYRVAKGVNAKVRYETFDPDDDISGDDLKRYMAGIDLHPFPYIEFNLQYRHTDDPAEDFNEYLAMIHLWF